MLNDPVSKRRADRPDRPEGVEGRHLAPIRSRRFDDDGVALVSGRGA